MSVGLFLTLLVGVIIAGFLLASVATRKPSGISHRVSRRELAERKLTNTYYRSISKGDLPRPLARVYSQMDMALILSLLSATNIAAQTLFAITNKVRTGLGVRGYNDCYVMVLNTQYHRASVVLADYLRRRRSVSSSVRGRTRLRNMAEVLLLGWAVNSQYLPPELLGDHGRRRSQGRRLARWRPPIMRSGGTGRPGAAGSPCRSRNAVHKQHAVSQRKYLLETAHGCPPRRLLQGYPGAGRRATTPPLSASAERARG